MSFQHRAQRWPSSWQVVLRYGVGRTNEILVEIRNISASGCIYAAPSALTPGMSVEFDVGDEVVKAHAVRCLRQGGALSFQRPLSNHQLDNLRQFRRLGDPAASEREDAPSDDELLKAISDIL